MRAVSNSFAANSSRSCISVSIGSFGEGSVAITRLPGIGQFVIVAEDSISFRSCSRINDGKQMLAYSLCLLEIHTAADHPIKNYRAIVLEF